MILEYMCTGPGYHQEEDHEINMPHTPSYFWFILGLYPRAMNKTGISIFQGGGGLGEAPFPIS